MRILPYMYSIKCSKKLSGIHLFSYPTKHIDWYIYPRICCRVSIYCISPWYSRGPMEFSSCSQPPSCAPFTSWGIYNYTYIYKDTYMITLSLLIHTGLHTYIRIYHYYHSTDLAHGVLRVSSIKPRRGDHRGACREGQDACHAIGLTALTLWYIEKREDQRLY